MNTPTTNFLIENGNRCSIPWIHTEINLQNNTVKPCCKYPISLGSLNNFESIWYSEEYNKLRSDIVNNIEHKNCNKCNVPDTEFSYRNYKNSGYKKMFDIKLEPVELPRVFNISLKNTCNLACRMCFPGSSSKLNELVKGNMFFQKIYGLPPIDNNFNIESLSGIFVNAEQVTFSGGEPLLHNNCVEIIKIIGAESKNLKRIIFSTNMTNYNDKLVNELSKLNAPIEFNISLDGPKHIQEYIRVGSSLDVMIENIVRLKETINPSFGINSTISLLNVGYVTEIIKTIHQISKQTGVIFTHIMTSPVLEEHLHVGNIPTEIKNIYIKKILSQGNFLKTIPGQDTLITSALGLLEQQRTQWSYALEFLKQFDSLTGTNYLDVYPEFKI
jgi:sulfatase maturation enzyme AslB (radical SAM superfamily)